MCIWDLREPVSLHASALSLALRIATGIRPPTYSTDALSTGLDQHCCRVVRPSCGCSLSLPRNFLNGCYVSCQAPSITVAVLCPIPTVYSAAQSDCGGSVATACTAALQSIQRGNGR